MTTIVSVSMRYGIGDEPDHVVRKSFIGNEAPSDSIFGGDVVDYTSGRVNGEVTRHVRDWLNTYAQALSLVARFGTKLRSASATLYDTDSEFGTPVAIKEYEVGDLICEGNPDNWGPRGSIFIASPQPVPSSGRKGWLRFYAIAKEQNDLPKLFSASQVSNDFAGALTSLGNFGVSTALENKLLSYAILSKAVSPEPTWVVQNKPGLNLHMGVVNG